MLDVMKKIAAASNGIDFSEEIIIESFQTDLTEYFNTDLDKMG